MKAVKFHTMLVLCAALALISCVAPTATSAPTFTPTPALTPRQVLARSSEAMQGLQSLEFSMTHEKGNSPLFPGLSATKIEGAVKLPDRVQMRVEAQVAILRAFVEIKIVVIGSQGFMTDPITGAWVEVSPETLPFNFVNAGATLADILESLEQPRFDGTESVGDVQSQRITGSLSSEALQTLVPTAEAGLRLDLTVWIDSDDYLLRKAQITGRITDMDPTEVVRVLSFRNFDSPIDIQPPQP